MRRKKSRGQALVEFALVFPLLMTVTFGSMEFGYYIFAWSEINFGARRGGEQASLLPPRLVQTPAAYHASAYSDTDPCLQLITEKAGRSGALNAATQIGPLDIFISFHEDADDATVRTTQEFRAKGRVIQVRVIKTLAPLTPLGDVMAETGDNPDEYEFSAVSRRTILSTGPTIGGTSPQLRTCQF